MKMPTVNSRNIDTCASSMNAASAPELTAKNIDTCASSLNHAEAVATAEPDFEKQSIATCASSMSAAGKVDSFTTTAARPDYSKFTG